MMHARACAAIGTILWAGGAIADVLMAYLEVLYAQTSIASATGAIASAVVAFGGAVLAVLPAYVKFRETRRDQDAKDIQMHAQSLQGQIEDRDDRIGRLEARLAEIERGRDDEERRLKDRIEELSKDNKVWRDLAQSGPRSTSRKPRETP